MNSIFKWLLSGLIVYSVFKYRYKLLNFLLGSYWIRKMGIKIAMNIPGFKTRILQSTFK
ncbi:hypothetical protein MXL46_00100 [Heyndrickxia sporothermodurans]|uniref:Uncharacterized protein n=1 Tax=Heyndrickxia sporothermodurans TaxID=46224 RepID=A0A150KN15_9BACI|nr:hypothetical protein [Heyndrickxia sporothermodurans]KYC95064.1 hypothetical protein B4102_1335 [Heyndrickxia sporothermodurans]MEB6547505.1 hypothetical protein [Heyndrickxia sporothermodurans]MED3649134.1 hypothetical protein [Heyndrickxia sporothermodurans]MED3654193.1 hypothetical protein [Heyndrickxia sporothermodurans]MED3696743.1 hypothetical protein [Heyndrickxia sporothermodurans]